MASDNSHFNAPRDTKKLSQTSEPSPDFCDNRFKLRPQRRVNLETLIEIPPRFLLAPLLQIADAAIEEGQGAARIEDERLVVIVHRSRQIAAGAARIAAIAVGDGLARIQLDGARVIRNGPGVIAFRLPGVTAVEPCALITRGEPGDLIEFGDGFFKPAFVVQDAPAVETRLEVARIEFNGAVEIVQRRVRVSCAAANQAAIIPGFAQLRVEHESAIQIRRRSARVSAVE